MASSNAVVIPPASGTPLAGVIADIQEWLDEQHIEPVAFRTVVSASRLGFEISFKSDADAERFRRRFPSFEPVGA
jgi:hypothetical protein